MRGTDTAYSQGSDALTDSNLHHPAGTARRALRGVHMVLAAALLVAAPAAAYAAQPAAPIRILFNDHRIDARPTRLRAGRVLAALVRGTTILVPLRALLEQTGAHVRYDASTRTVDVANAGSDVAVTVGSPEVRINGIARPLDVPPEIVDGVLLVPLRVVGEALGAYVQWVPQQRTVVVRYIAARAPAPPVSQTPVPPPAHASAMPVSVTPPAATTRRYDRFIAGDDVLGSAVFNEFSPGNHSVGTSYATRGALEFALLRVPLLLAGEYRGYRYPHHAGTRTPGDPGYVTVIGRYGQTFVPAFTAHESDLSGRLGIRLAAPRIYIAASYLHREQNYGYPKQNGVGFGIEKLPDLDRPFSLYASVYDYPDVRGSYTFVNSDPYADAAGLTGTTRSLSNRDLTYEVGVTLMLAGASREYGAFLDGGYLGDALRAGAYSPADAAHHGAYLGLGLKF